MTFTNPPARRRYQRLLSSYQSSRNPVYRRLFRLGLRLALAAVRSVRRVHFPARATGGWWWTCRWRFEVLMGWNEYESVWWCRRLIEPGMTVVDVGAHIGYYTRLFSDLVGPAGRVFAFEPHPENLAVLRANLRHRRYRNVELLPLAASDRSGRAILNESPGSSTHSLLSGHAPLERRLEVETVELDRFLAERRVERLDFLKVDVEGAEPLVLAGCRRTAARSPRLAMLVEDNAAALACGERTSADLVKLIEELGLTAHRIRSDGSLDPITEPPVPQREAPVANLLCLPRAPDPCDLSRWQ